MGGSDLHFSFERTGLSSRIHDGHHFTCRFNPRFIRPLAQAHLACTFCAWSDRGKAHLHDQHGRVENRFLYGLLPHGVHRSGTDDDMFDHPLRQFGIQRASRIRVFPVVQPFTG